MHLHVRRGNGLRERDLGAARGGADRRVDAFRLERADEPAAQSLEAVAIRPDREHAELVAAEPRHEVVHTDGAHEHVPGVADQLVAGRPAVLVVATLQAVEVEHEHTGRVAVAGAARLLGSEDFVPEPSVGDTGQRIRARAALGTLAAPPLGVERALRRHDLAQQLGQDLDHRKLGGDLGRLRLRIDRAQRPEQLPVLVGDRDTHVRLDAELACERRLGVCRPVAHPRGDARRLTRDHPRAEGVRPAEAVARRHAECVALGLEHDLILAGRARHHPDRERQPRVQKREHALRMQLEAGVGQLEDHRVGDRRAADRA
ncbi:MAG TPA: hypothetical protein VFU10_07485 [Gaiellaceae bacterium]|nr:hypothetical protein [Gaiellaceae bacterium]